ncbi:MAG: hypothetical protein ABIN67_13575 [Ferruginibacter sp.]
MEKIVSCKLTSRELQKYKTEVIAGLKANILERRELDNGYQYSFNGSDEMIDNITSFIKAERACCSFFTFNLLIEDDSTNILLEITGPDSAKKFINQEMDL